MSTRLIVFGLLCIILIAAVVSALRGSSFVSSLLTSLWKKGAESSLNELRQEDQRLDGRMDSHQSQLGLQETQLREHSVQLSQLRRDLDQEEARSEEQAERIRKMTASVTQLEAALELQRSELAALTAARDDHARRLDEAETSAKEQAKLLDRLSSLERSANERERLMEALIHDLSEIEKTRAAERARIRKIEQILGLEPEP